MTNILLLLLVIISTIDMVLNFILLMDDKKEPVKVMVKKALGLKKKAFVPHKDPDNILDGMIGPNFE